MKRKINILTIILTVMFSFSTFAAAAGSPMDAVRSTVDAVLDTMKDKSLAGPSKKQERREQIRSLISERFDFEEMAKRSLARHWKKRTPEEKKEFVDVFAKLLQASYIGKIEAYTNEKITYDKETIKGKGKYAVVKTSIMTKDLTIPIDYKVINKKDKWRVYDVIIEGVSFISTYRSQYNKIIARESYAKLIEKMKTKLDEVNTL